VEQLKRHALFDALLLFGPPAGAAWFVIALLFQTGRLAPLPAIVAAAMILMLLALGVLLRSRPARPSVGSAARLVDQKSGALDHFLTLTTIDPATESPALLARLRQQTTALGHRVELARDFPYRFKPAAFWSLGASLLAALLIYLFLPLPHASAVRRDARERLAEVVKQMAAHPTLRELAQELQALGVKLDQPISSSEKKNEIDRMEQRIEEQRAKEQNGDQRDLLGEAASALEGLEKQQQVAGAGQGEKQQEKGSGGIQSNVPQDGEGESKENQSGGADGKGEPAAQMSQQKMDSGKSAQADPKEQGQNKNQTGEAKNDQNQPDPNNPSQEQTKQKAGKSQGDSKEGAGKQQASEEPPQGGPQADRFYKPGEGKEGLAGKKGYVTVQLPEDVVADSKGASAASKDARNGQTRSKVPVSNVPLPAHVPNAPAEKQQVPLEYRGILR
jgi:hypothetical protein